MKPSTADFRIAVQGVEGLCPVGEAHAERNIAEKKLPVLSCEGPCIRGEIARLAADIVVREVSGYARACHGETFFVPHTAMACWVRDAEQSVMIDGCFLRCHGRVLSNLVGADKVVHIDANRIHHKYPNVFLSDDVPEVERKATAREVANRIIQMLANDEHQKA